HKRGSDWRGRVTLMFRQRCDRCSKETDHEGITSVFRAEYFIDPYGRAGEVLAAFAEWCGTGVSRFKSVVAQCGRISQVRESPRNPTKALFNCRIAPRLGN